MADAPDRQDAGQEKTLAGGAALVAAGALIAAINRKRAKRSAATPEPKPDSEVLARRGRLTVTKGDAQTIASMCAWAARYRVTTVRYQDLENVLTQAIQRGRRDELDVITSFVRFARDLRRQQASNPDPTFQDSLRREAFNQLLALQMTMTTEPNALIDWSWRLNADQPQGSPPPFALPGARAQAGRQRAPGAPADALARQQAAAHRRSMATYASQARRAGLPPPLGGSPVGESLLDTSARTHQMKMDTMRWSAHHYH
jgi:hypothetical protein